MATRTDKSKSVDCSRNTRTIWIRYLEDVAKSAHSLPLCNGWIYLSPQVVREQKSKLDEQMELISDLQGTAWQLQAEALTNQFHMQKQQCAQEEMKSQAEVLQHTELQTRVALERITSKVNVCSFTSDFHLSVKRCSSLVKSIWMPKNHTRRLNTSTSFLFQHKFERFRSKIIQATFSTAGIKAPQAELTDEEVLEAMQVCSSLELQACGELLRKHCRVLLSF